MMEVKADVNNEISLVVIDLLDRVNIIKEDIKKSMMVGERKILKGVTIFEEVIKSMNINEVNDDILDQVEKRIGLVISSMEDKSQKVDHFAHIGIDRCSLMLYMYNKEINRKKEKILK